MMNKMMSKNNKARMMEIQILKVVIRSRICKIKMKEDKVKMEVKDSSVKTKVHPTSKIIHKNTKKVKKKAIKRIILTRIYLIKMNLY